MIQIKYQNENRLTAINNISRAILNLTEALKATPEILIKDNVIQSTSTGISIITEEQTTETVTYIEKDVKEIQI